MERWSIVRLFERALSLVRCWIDELLLRKTLSFSLCWHGETNYNRERDIGTRYPPVTDPSDDVFIGVSSIRYYRRHRILYPRRCEHVSLLASDTTGGPRRPILATGVEKPPIEIESDEKSEMNPRFLRSNEQERKIEVEVTRFVTRRVGFSRVICDIEG